MDARAESAITFILANNVETRLYKQEITKIYSYLQRGLTFGDRNKEYSINVKNVSLEVAPKLRYISEERSDIVSLLEL